MEDHPSQLFSSVTSKKLIQTTTCILAETVAEKQNENEEEAEAVAEKLHENEKKQEKKKKQEENKEAQVDLE